MRVGFDIDGVLANFTPAYQRLVIEEADGVNLFQSGDDVNPPTWHWPEHRGYSPLVTQRVWARIAKDPTFWLNLGKLPDCDTLRLVMPMLEREHEVYFVTARPGERVKRQTELWLYEHLAYPANIGSVWPTVLISKTKGKVASALKLDVYVDDNYDNAVDCLWEAPDTRTYLLDRAYNTGLGSGEIYNGTTRRCIRVDSLSDVLSREF